MKDSTMIDITLAKDVPHRTTITDNGIEYWTVTAITQHIGVAKSTFASYVARGQSPQPAFPHPHPLPPQGAVNAASG